MAYECLFPVSSFHSLPHGLAISSVTDRGMKTTSSLSSSSSVVNLLVVTVDNKKFTAKLMHVILHTS